MPCGEEVSTPPEKLQLEHLKGVVKKFSDETERLEEAYTLLIEKFHQVHNDLEGKNLSLENKVKELDIISSYLSEIVDRMEQGLMVLDHEGKITTFNKKAEDLLRKPAEKVLFHSFSSIFEDTFFGFSLKECLEKKLSLPTHPFSVKEEGEERSFEAEVTYIEKKEEDRLFSGCLILFREITEMRRLATEAARQNRFQELGEMANTLAHEIRNPLGGIKGFATILEKDLATDAQKAKMAHHIIEGADALARLVTSILTFARPLTLEMKRENLQKLISNATEYFEKDSAYKEGLELIIEMPETPCSATVDPASIGRVILNLLINAAQASTPPAKIILTLQETKNKIHLSVRDFGKGIDKEILPKIFSPLFTTKKEGSGLGLAEVQKIIHSHGGSIEVNSEKDKGAEFTLHLPK